MSDSAPEVSLLDMLTTEGARVAGAYLVRTFADDVYGLCRAIVRDRVLAEDLAHDAFARALVALPAYRGEASARTWLLTIARHRCFDHLRAQKRERALMFDDPGAPETEPEDAPLVIDRMTSEESLRDALDALDEGDRALVVLRHAHAMGFAELARVFGVREGAIRMRLSRATARMKAALDAGDVLEHAAPPIVPSPAMSAPRQAAPIARAPASYGAPPAPAPVRGRVYPVATLAPSLPRDVASHALVARLEALAARVI